MHEPEREHSGGGAPTGRWQGRSRRGRALIAATTVAVLALGGTVAYAATSGGSGGTAPAAPGSSSSAAPSPDRHGRGPWSGFGGEGVHGEATVKDPGSGDWIVRTWQRGTVEKTDGASWTWTVGKDTAVRREKGSTAGADTLKKGDTVLVVGTRDGGTRTADRVLSGTSTDHDDDGDHGRKDGRDGHGPFGDRPGHRWGGDDATPSPAPSGSGAAA
ncbi:hypothetical protein ACH4UY_19745 [Streptomyces longwoodensis]|uniref:hypothetical protein n=1 Tax=Streptomyces longwoodensis TaxID=68231 RepID=UPI0037A6D7E9